MGLRVAINGFGRIGRLVYRSILEKYDAEIEVVAINDLVPPENLAYLLKYDSVHGRAPFALSVEGEHIVAKGKKTRVTSEKDPAKLPWKGERVDYVVESTGFFTQLDDAAKHLEAGAKRVVISAPGKGDMPTLVMGVNHEEYDPSKHQVVSNASCTTNCLAPLVKVLLDNFGIDEGLMTTVHAMTASQPSVDGPSKKDWRGGRAASLNIIPSSTGAAKAVGLCLPRVKGILTGMAFRVPVADVSAVDFNVRVSRDTTYEEICQAMLRASQTSMKGVLYYCDEEVVSSDFIGTTYSSVFDVRAGIALNSRFFKLVAWYDNEVAYANRVVDLMRYMATRESTPG